MRESRPLSPMENIGSNADSTTASTGESMTTTVTTNTTLDSSPIHWQNTFAATNLPTPGARENSLLSNIKTFRPISALALPARLRPKAQSPCIQQTNRNRPIRETGARQTVFSLSKAARNRQGRIAYSEPSQSNCHNRPQISNVEKRKAGCSPLSRQPLTQGVNCVTRECTR